MVDGLLLDIDGVLAVSWEPIDGAVETLAWLRAQVAALPSSSNRYVDVE